MGDCEKKKREKKEKKPPPLRGKLLEQSPSSAGSASYALAQAGPAQWNFLHTVFRWYAGYPRKPRLPKLPTLSTKARDLRYPPGREHGSDGKGRRAISRHANRPKPHRYRGGRTMGPGKLQCEQSGRPKKKIQTNTP